jgi:DNA-binding NtrC family response regulator
VDGVPEEVMELLKGHDWPGNIRELQNFVERAVVMSSGPVLRPSFAELKPITRSSSPADSRTLAAAERDHILDVLDQTNWLIGGQVGAASRLGLPRTTLIYKMRKLGIDTRKTHHRPFMQGPLASPASQMAPATAAVL